MIVDSRTIWAPGMNRVIARYAGADPAAGWLPRPAPLEARI
jgi:hypothetical protein